MDPNPARARLRRVGGADQEQEDPPDGDRFRPFKQARRITPRAVTKLQQRSDAPHWKTGRFRAARAGTARQGRLADAWISLPSPDRRDVKGEMLHSSHEADLVWQHGSRIVRRDYFSIFIVVIHLEGEMPYIAKLACIAAVIAAGSAIAIDPILAQSRTAAATADSSDWWTKDVTVVTMAPGGAWGTATEPTASVAIAKAIGSCQAKMSGAERGCGAYLATIRGGWIVGLRCGDRSILAADHDLAEAKRIAADRESELRQRYVPDLAACVRVLTVDPRGAIVPSELASSRATRVR
jgi:hypothetical protein